MKCNAALMLGMSMAAVSGTAWAGNDASQDPLNRVTVHAHPYPYATADRPLGDCTPPSDLRICTALHQQIRKEFTRDEIGMLFGAATAYPEYLTSYSRVIEHYRKFLQDLDATTNTAVSMTER